LAGVLAGLGALAVADGGVELAVGTETEATGVVGATVIGDGDGFDDLGLVGGLAVTIFEAQDMVTVAVGIRVVGVDEMVGGVVRVDRQAEHAGLAILDDRESYERLGLEDAVADDADLAQLDLAEEELAAIGRKGQAERHV